MLENVRLSFQGIWSHKMRSFLTMLGIIIGIASIISIVSTIKGTNEQIKQNLIGAGNNNVTVSLKQGYHDYWDGDTAMVKFYRDKHKRDLDRQNFNHWMQGMYIYEALVDASPVFNPLSEKHEPFPYMKEPIPITIEAIKETEERQNQQKMKNGKDAMRAWMVEFNKRFEEKQREGGEIDNEC